MEMFVFVAVIVMIVFIVKLRNNVTDHFLRLEQQIAELKEVLEKSTLVLSPTVTPATVQEKTAPSVEPIIHPPSNTTQPTEEERLDEELAHWQPEAEPALAPEPIPVISAAAFTQAPAFTSAKPTKPAENFFDRHPDIEKFIGENLVSKIGIAILVLAIAYFVKFAIDSNWIGEAGRVAIGLVCGGILTGLAYKMRHSYKAFSSVLTGGGLAVFYFTIALAYHQFHLFSQTAAFIIMLVITAFAVGQSLLYNRQEVAILALVGGFASPFMVSDGSGNYKTLFIYLILLNSGLLVLAYNKAWRLLNLLSFVFTALLVGGWLFSLPVSETHSTYVNGFIFLTVFYLMFFFINIAHNIKENEKFIASDFGILLANTALYFAAGLYCLYHMDAALYKGLFSAGMGVFNLAASYLLFRNKKVDLNILYLLIGITLTFISLSAPLQLDGNFITLFWASECVVLYWLHQKSRIPIILTASLVIWVCMLFSLVIDWYNIYSFERSPLRFVLNKAFVTTVYSFVATFLMFQLAAGQKQISAPNITALSRYAFQYVGLGILMVGCILEINHQFNIHYPNSELGLVYIEGFILAAVLALVFARGVSFFILPAFKKQLLLAAGILTYVVLIDYNYYLQLQVLSNNQFKNLFTIGHILVAVLTAIVIYRAVRFAQQSGSTTPSSTFFAWIMCILIVLFISVEVNMLVRSLFFDLYQNIADLQRVFIKTVLPIVWGVCSFAFMWLGMRYRFRPLRIVSLSLFTLTLFKLFAFDIRNIPVAGKILAFFCLGILLLIVSFMYQRLKKLIIEDEQKVTN